MVSFDTIKNSLRFSDRSSVHDIPSRGSVVQSFISSDPIQLESAQTALFVAVIKATPNQVIMSVARDYVCTIVQELVTRTTSYIPRYRSPLHYYFNGRSSSMSPTSIKRIKDHCHSSGHGIDMSGSKCDGIIGQGVKMEEVVVENGNGKDKCVKISDKYQKRRYQVSKKYEVFYAFIKLFLKLILNFILEIISFTLKFI